MRSKTSLFSLYNFKKSVRQIDRDDKHRRFIDDGAGFHLGSEEEFHTLLRAVNVEISLLGLYIDESALKKNSCYLIGINFRED